MSDDEELAALLATIGKRQETMGEPIPERVAFLNALSVTAELSVGFELTHDETQTVFPIILDVCKRGLIR